MTLFSIIHTFYVFFYFYMYKNTSIYVTFLINMYVLFLFKIVGFINRTPLIIVLCFSKNEFQTTLFNYINLDKVS